MGLNDIGPHDRGLEELVGSTRHGVVERLADPYLSDHDRWVLRQFAVFLSGIAPGPDPRGLPVSEHAPTVRLPSGTQARTKRS